MVLYATFNDEAATSILYDTPPNKDVHLPPLSIHLPPPANPLANALIAWRQMVADRPSPAPAGRAAHR